MKLHNKYKGGLNYKSTGIKSLFYENTYLQIMYHVSTLISSNNLIKKKHIGNDFIHIIWNESNQEYLPNTISSKFNFIHIIINPLKFNLYKIQIYIKDTVQLKSFGPLKNNMIIPKYLLHILITQTVINASKNIKQYLNGKKIIQQYQIRKDYINNIKQKYIIKNQSIKDKLNQIFNPNIKK